MTSSPLARINSPKADQLHFLEHVEEDRHVEVVEYFDLVGHVHVDVFQDFCPFDGRQFLQEQLLVFQLYVFALDYKQFEVETTPAVQLLLLSDLLDSVFSLLATLIQYVGFDILKSDAPQKVGEYVDSDDHANDLYNLSAEL
eukprot:CAMPEP_0116901672 /NCGR_PEP_ID=MMETSP0467-20121206/9514_1 /TAXON_ID=283647 /ORGANISM="Mesodinium pulex, Strain SPMC105" /LENGTH=141 /DNA_ID=CAMNT_0004575273 /DNA_START=70 /DNA_END=494 /DNA_ORIENTATION=-